MNKELKTEIKEFTRKYFPYHQTDKKLSDKVKEELERLGACKPFYSEDQNQRSIIIAKILNSEQEEIKNLVLKEVQKHFLIKNTEEANALLEQIKTYQSNLETRMRKMKEARERKLMNQN
jgi:hypothetical protein